ncbi:MAG: hypothetical protein COA96_05760 [SAR86 cluster bacterium]|uniref:Uncharacterized protein n=1 Tax=SAR86 cluster bacterium TaxID=2030880 RepID=A0A2A5B3V9_9GAMM|nr:MAG: hypothetical protein COA96_05760 [SAR86 cluster bacterium]
MKIFSDMAMKFMKIFSDMAMKLRFLVLLAVLTLLTSCIGTVIGAAVDTTIEVAKVPFKIVGAAVDLAIPDNDDDD